MGRLDEDPVFRTVNTEKVACRYCRWAELGNMKLYNCDEYPDGKPDDVYYDNAECPKFLASTQDQRMWENVLTADGEVERRWKAEGMPDPGFPEGGPPHRDEQLYSDAITYATTGERQTSFAYTERERRTYDGIVAEIKKNRAEGKHFVYEIPFSD